MKKVLFTIATQDYVDKAKQLFSSVYHKSGWTGDYLIFHDGIRNEDLNWFKSRDIFTHKIKSMIKSPVKTQWNDSIWLKLSIFDPYLKRWEKALYLDSDMIVRYSLDDLDKYNGLWAASDADSKILHQFNHGLNKTDTEQILISRLKKKFNIMKTALNSGMFWFDTKIIDKGIISRLLRYYDDYHEIIFSPDQALYNLVFYGKWKKLPKVYNVLVPKLYSSQNHHHVNGINIHLLVYPKPWVAKKEFYEEWKANIDRADDIDLRKRITGNKMSLVDYIPAVIYNKLLYLIYGWERSYLIAVPKLNRLLGKFGIVIRKILFINTNRKKVEKTR
ncbi:hypothetical protein H6503_02520 [Candidatus Woesearchaeota archaeon]|nr:hypothetical protein [Candidatus Woesearchaeota archaeon]